MIINSYDTSATKAFDMIGIENDIRKHILLKQPDGYNSQVQTVASTENFRNGDIKVYRLVSGDDVIAPFSHPHIITNTGGNNKTKANIFIDARSFTRTVSKTNEVVISDLTQYNLLLDRAMLQLAVISEGDDVLLQLGNYPIIVYANWLAENLGRRVGADLESQSNIAIIAALYYYSQFIDTFNEEEQLNLARICGNIVHFKNIEILNLLEQVGKINNLDEFVKAVAEHSGSMRLKDLKVATLYTYVGGSWFGMGRVELMAVSLEHLPTFITLCFYALTTRNYRNTELSKIALRYERTPEAKAFARAFMDLRMRYNIE